MSIEANYEPSEYEPESIAQMAAMLRAPEIERAQRITQDLKFALKRLAQTETTISPEQINHLFDEAISRCRSEVLVVAVQQMAIQNLETVRQSLLSPPDGQFSE